MFWKRFTELWVPGIVTSVVFTLLGAFIGWKISYEDTQAQISGLQEANKGLREINKGQQEANIRLEEQAHALQDQRAASLSQASQLAGIVRTLAAQGRDLKLALDNRGNVTLGGHPIVDSRGHVIGNSNGGAILTTESGIPIVTENGQPILVEPHGSGKKP